jgi:hypothetical protein
MMYWIRDWFNFIAIGFVFVGIAIWIWGFWSVFSYAFMAVFGAGPVMWVFVYGNLYIMKWLDDLGLGGAPLALFFIFGRFIVYAVFAGFWIMFTIEVMDFFGMEI